MASRKDEHDESAWAEAEDLFVRGDTLFVDRLRRYHNADILAAFAARWFADRRPQARQMLRDYLSRPLNAYRHEALVKRLFKMAEAANDDELMAYFLVLFDRSIRRVKRRGHRSKSRLVDDRTVADELIRRWQSEGYEYTNIWSSNNKWVVYALSSG